MLLRRAFTLRPQASRLVRTMASAPNNFGVPSASELMQDSELAAMPAEVKAKYAGPASDDAIERTRKGLEQFKHTVEVVDKPADALASILKIVPAGVDVTSVGSTTLVRLFRSITNPDANCMMISARLATSTCRSRASSRSLIFAA